MNEIEVKIMDINPDSIKNKLKLLHAKPTGDGVMEIMHFDFPDGRIQKNDEILRLRKIHGRVELVYKQNLGGSKDFKSMKEYETTIADFDAMAEILKRLGFVVYFHYEKKRETFALEHNGKKIKFEIDYYPGINPLIEVEANNEASVEEGVKLLGYEMKDTTTLSGNPFMRKYYPGKTHVTFTDYEKKTKIPIKN